MWRCWPRCTAITLSKPATQKILYHSSYEIARRASRPADISAHLYNLRKKPGYRERRLPFERRGQTSTAIRRSPPSELAGRLGFVRAAMVYQGDLDGVNGVDDINAVDEVTQREVEGYGER